MAEENLKSTIQSLHQALEQAGPIDPELRELLGELDRDLHRVLSSKAASEGDEGGLQERLESMAADFDSRHPQLSAVLRELGDALARVGI